MTSVTPPRADHPSAEEIREAFGLATEAVADLGRVTAEVATEMAAEREAITADTGIRSPADVDPIIANRRATRLAKDTVKKHDAIQDAYGIYVEAVIYDPTDTGSPFRRVVKGFLAENMVVAQVRDKGKKAARWTFRTYRDHDEARAKFQRWIQNSTPGSDSGYAIQMRGRPQLVQMNAQDVESIRAGRMPAARFAGFNEITHTEGKLDDATWKPVTS